MSATLSVCDLALWVFRDVRAHSRNSDRVPKVAATSCQILRLGLAERPSAGFLHWRIPRQIEV